MARKEYWVEDIKRNAIDNILRRISNGESVRSVLSDNRDKEVLPSRKTFFEWLLDDKTLSDQYAHACEKRADAIFEEILDIADETHSDKKVLEDGREVIDNEVVQRSRLRVDARKWMLSKMNPKKYSDKIQVDTSTFEEQPLFPDVSKNDSDK